MLTPVIIGFGIDWRALGVFSAAVIVVGQLMANYLSNSGGAWDNAKKYIEDGNHGGKGSEAHKAAVIGDTVGDPFKDTAGPALNPLIKVMNLVRAGAAGDHRVPGQRRRALHDRRRLPDRVDRGDRLLQPQVVDPSPRADDIHHSRSSMLALLPGWLDPHTIIEHGGLWLVAAIVFAESGLLFGFFPGDTLLFITGFLTSKPEGSPHIDHPLPLVLLVLFVAAVLGDQVGYLFGRGVGPALFHRPSHACSTPPTSTRRTSSSRVTARRRS